MSFHPKGRPFVRGLKALLAERSGNTVMIFALCLVPIIMGVGMTVDFNRAETAQQSLQQIADAAALDAVISGIDNDADLQERVTTYFTSHAEGYPVNNLNITAAFTEDGTVSVSATGKLESAFMQVGDFPDMSVSVNSHATGGGEVGLPLEMVISIDVTNSMSDIGDINDVSEVLEAVLAEVNASQPGGVDPVISFIPYSDRVNIGRRFESWITGSRPSNWNGCVEPRDETVDGLTMSLTDASPDDIAFEYSIPRVTGGLANTAGWYRGPVCVSEVAGPTTDLDVIQDGIDAVFRNGTGRFDMALAWCWRFLSPEWEGQFDISDYPAQYDEARKVIIFITDLTSMAYWHEVTDTPYRNRTYNAPWSRTPDIIPRWDSLCDRIRETGTEIWIVGVGMMAENEEYAEQCVGDVTRYLNPDDLSEFQSFLETAANGNGGTGDIRLIR